MDMLSLATRVSGASSLYCPTRPGAIAVEPGVEGGERIVMEFAGRESERDRWCARAEPTMPAPTMRVWG